MKFSCCVKNLRGVKFSRFRLIRRKILTVDGYNVDECLESFLCSVYMYYQVFEEPGIAVYSRRSDIYLWGCGLERTLIH